MKMKNRIILCFAIMLCMALTACGSAPDTAARIKISGSTSVFPVIDGLKDLFESKNPDIKVEVEQGGSGVGISNAKTGIVDIGMSSRFLKTDEKPLTQTVLCLDGIAVVVNKQNPVSNLSPGQIAKIYDGRIKNWKEVGGNDARITLVTREVTSGTRGAFEELIMEGQLIDDRLCLVQNSTGNAALTVQNDRNAITYMSLGVLDHFDSLKAVSVGGIAATTGNVKNGTYPLSRPFLLLTRGEPSGAVKVFMDYVTKDPDARSFITKSNLILPG